ncbi:MAG: ABC transporter ATP-binding protein [Candidatus Delongbacteria bacterium]|nr:ABC transporter ATP-binding protein [Candidatus Delongbacteria bacterium]MBN2836048.1 ABC transporter ATP-binding protein [Candidatus Delongbacteria bacterium]
MKGVSLKLEKICSGYGNKRIIEDIDLDINAGEIISVCGPNGTGKSTLFKTISGFLKPISGNVIIDGKNIKSHTLKEMAAIMAVVKQFLTPATITVFDYVSMGRYPYFKPLQFFRSKNDLDKTEEYINLTGISQLTEKELDEISGGERQLAQIAKALCQEPGLMLLDEPVSSLDISHQIQIMDILRKLNRKFGMTILIVLHDLNLAAEYSDRVVLMNNGKIRIFDTAENVFKYDIIEEVYKTPVIVKESPLSKKPYVIPVPEDYCKG